MLPVAGEAINSSYTLSAAERIAANAVLGGKFASGAMMAANHTMKVNLAICDLVLSKSYKFDHTYFKLQTFYYLYGKEKATEYLYVVRKRHPSLFYPLSRTE